MSAATKPVILMYHSIAAGGSPLETSPDTFARQMEWLSTHARVAPLSEVVDSVAGGKPLPPKTVVLTFDDGFADFYSQAAPVLRQFGFPATVFLPTAYCGRTNQWPGQPAWVPERPLMTWEQIRELAGNGYSFGAHSEHHPDLTAISCTEAEREIAGSRREIESRVGRPADYFCYPYGKWNAAVRELVARSYRGACATSAGAVELDADPHALPRVDAHYLRSPLWFGRLFTRRFLTYLAARRTVRRLRGKPEGAYARQ